MRSWSGYAAAGLGALALGVAACKSTPTGGNNCGSGAPPNLSGSYLLSSYTEGSQTWTSPPSSGTLRVAGNAYVFSMDLSTGTGLPTVVHDSGTYQMIGASCIRQVSALDTTLFSGSIVLQTASGITTLRESGTDGTNEIIWLWVKN